MIWHWLRRHPQIVDIGLVLLILAPTIGAATRHHHVAAGIILGSCETLPLLVRRRFPVGVTIVVAALAVAMALIGVWLLPLQSALALYTLAALADRRAARIVGAAAIAAITAVVFADGSFQLGDAVARTVFLVAAWLLGESIGTRRAYLHEVEEKANRLECEREAHQQRVAAEEQARIARELHDVIAHALSVIVGQASAADDVFDIDPGRARVSIKAVERAARSALGELRHVLGIVRVNAEYEPQPGIAQLDELIERVRATGLDVSFRTDGRPVALPAAVELSVYRIVQEALTNTLKHSDASHVTVSLRFGAELGLEIRDDGQNPVEGANGNGGRGLIGMHERVATFGGNVETGPAWAGGYVVTARIPINSAE